MSRPRKYKTPAELEAKIEEYKALNLEKPTKCGLALHLGFADKVSLMDYCGSRETTRPFSTVIERALA